MKITNCTNGSLLAGQAQAARTMFSRMKGLLGRRNLSPGEALILPACQCIHMFFMRFPIDVLFVDRDNRAAGAVQNIQPFQISPIFWTARYAVELPSGTIQATNTRIGDRLEISS